LGQSLGWVKILGRSNGLGQQHQKKKTA
jgi:hypothetical protein